MDTPSVGWHPAHPDARGVIEVPEPPRTLQRQQDFAQGWSPSGGIRFKESNKNVVMASSVTVPEAFADAAPLLPVIASDYLGHQALSGADWCAARRQAESSEHFFDVGFSLESFSDVAGGPMPDGGGTGYLIRRQGTGPGHGPFTGVALLAQSGPSCDSAVFDPDSDLTASVVDGPAPSNRSFVSAVTAAMIWVSPANHTYLVVAAAPGLTERAGWAGHREPRLSAHVAIRSLPRGVAECQAFEDQVMRAVQDHQLLGAGNGNLRGRHVLALTR